LSTKTGNTVKAAENPDLVNQMVAQTLASVDTTPEPVAVMPPSDNLVTLPGGYITPAGEVIKTVEVRELNGKDEEAIARTTSMGKAILTILQRGTVKIGDMPVTEDLLDGLLAGDRDAIMLGIYKATFGKTADIQGVCLKENKFLDVKIDIDHDIEVRKMEDPYKRKFTLDCKVGSVEVVLPTGYVQKDLVNNTDKTVSELTTILLENCVITIDGSPVIGKAQVQNLGISDRRIIAEALNKYAIGPVFEELTLTCTDCGDGEVTVPINLGTLFRF
jgi:hypothetical protein